MKQFMAWAIAAANKIVIRLSLTFLLVTTLTVVIMALAINRTVAQSFETYLGRTNQAELGERIYNLESYYSEHQTWTGVRLESGRQGGSDNGGVRLFLTDTNFVIIATNDLTIGIGESLSSNQKKQASPLKL